MQHREEYPSTQIFSLKYRVLRWWGKVPRYFLQPWPIRWGIQIFALCCSTTSYLWNTAFYLGKRDESDAKIDTSVTQQTIVSLFEPLQEMYHKAYFEKCYADSAGKAGQCIGAENVLPLFIKEGVSNFIVQAHDAFVERKPQFPPCIC